MAAATSCSDTVRLVAWTPLIMPGHHIQDTEGPLAFRDLMTGVSQAFPTSTS
jgi:hypothetical protein